ncbi:MAG: hypothetical protein DSZ09_05920 [Sulfurovum sp.]|nr:MAG: hypothetical protein DSZ09_05920 [Sulfurovum sp.]
MVHMPLYMAVDGIHHRRYNRLDRQVVEKLNLQKDKVYVIDFFASWCHACKKELPLMNKVYNENIVKIIGVNIDKDVTIAKTFVTKNRVNFPVVYDSNQALISLFDPAGIPALYYVKNAKIIGMQIGATKAIDQKIKKTIKGWQ